jgi:HK97 family phage portal protein
MRWPWQKAPEAKNQFEDVLSRIIAAQEGRLGEIVTPETCMQSPTVHAIVTAISRRLSVTPIHIYRKGSSNGLDTKEKLPSHPVANLLRRPNPWQTGYEFFADATSAFVRYGNFYAYKARGATGPIRELVPLHPSAVQVKQDNVTGRVTYRVNEATGEVRDYDNGRIFHARGPSRNFIEGDSPVRDVAQAVALEVMAEKFGATFFQNGALPLMIFKFMAGAGGFRTKEEEARFIQDFQSMLGGQNRHRAMLLPKNIETGDPVRIDNDKAQFLETRKYQRTVIAGAFGVPPHLVGDLERATFNNVEQQDQDFTLNVVMPVAHAFEMAMERDLLTDDDRRSGVAIRFNLDSTLRADFKSRQEGLKVQREMGVISANEWREIEGKNPLPEGGNDYWQQGPSGQNADREETENVEAESDSTVGDQAA